MYKPDNSSPPPVSLSAAQARALRRRRCHSSGTRSRWRRVGV